MGSVFAEGLHAKRVLSQGKATLGVLNTASLAVNTIGRGLALTTSGVPKHATKQVDRLLSSEALRGAAGEALGYDRHLKTNTAKRRTISLFRQGCMLYELMLTMPEKRLLPLLERFTAELEQLPVFKAVVNTI